ncbi:FtsX-like permease family protein [compost metagenome]
MFNKEKTTVSFSKGEAITQLMGIETANFGRITWMRDGLLDYHYYSYLNLMAKDPSAVLISRSLAEQFDVKPGEYITMSWPGSVEARFSVYAIIDYWPSWSPLPQVAKEEAKASLPNLVVGHLPYIQNHMALEPYEVWLKLDEKTTMKQFYDELSKSDFRITKFTNPKQDLVNSRTDPFRLAINGVMTLGFVISIVVSFLGFILFWVLSLTSRVLQFGIFRAMGISFLQLIGVLAAEQILTSGAAIAIGWVTGYVASKLFVPFFQLSFNTTTQVPPFQVAFQVQDQIQLFSIITFMLLIGLLILGVMLSRIKIHQAIKLGEDG